MAGRTCIQPVILAGGSGSRLWPASRRDRPKQLLNLSGELSLLQETALRLRHFTTVPVSPHPVVVTNLEYRLVVSGQLRDVGVEGPRIILEPVGRGTAPALTLACLAMADQIGDPEDPDDPILFVMSSDHFIADIEAFHRAVAVGAEQAAAGMLVLFGVTPERAEPGYGHIEVGVEPEAASGLPRFVGFAEKPDLETAARYSSSGRHLWNSGMFMMRRSTWLSAVHHFRPDIAAGCAAALPSAESIGEFVRVRSEDFEACPSESIDRAVFERLSAADDAERDAPPGGEAGFEAVVVPLDCGWSDLGGWAALCRISPRDESGNVVRGNAVVEDTRGTLVHADSRLVAVLGVDDLVIVDTADALLVAGKEQTRDIKRLVSKVEGRNPRLTQRHQRQYRPWGRFDSIDTGERFQVKHIVVAPGGILSLQVHHHRAEHWVVVQGVAEVTCGEKTFRLEEDQSTYIPINTPHRLSNPGTEPLEIIEVQSGDYLGDDDIVRLEDHYGRLEDS